LRFSLLKNPDLGHSQRDDFGLITKPEGSNSLNFEAGEFKLAGRLRPTKLD